jgi:hypothetical protein
LRLLQSCKRKLRDFQPFPLGFSHHLQHASDNIMTRECSSSSHANKSRPQISQSPCDQLHPALPSCNVVRSSAGPESCAASRSSSAMPRTFLFESEWSAIQISIPRLQTWRRGSFRSLLTRTSESCRWRRKYQPLSTWEKTTRTSYSALTQERTSRHATVPDAVSIFMCSDGMASRYSAVCMW